MLPSLDNTIPKAAVRFERLHWSEDIPDEWITQVKDISVNPTKYKSAIDLSLQDTGMLFGLYTPMFSGFMWCVFEPVENKLFVNCYSVDRSLWHTKAHISALIKLLQWLKVILKVNTVAWFTTRPGLYKRLGYKPSKRILMEA